MPHTMPVKCNYSNFTLFTTHTYKTYLCVIGFIGTVSHISIKGHCCGKAQHISLSANITFQQKLKILCSLRSIDWVLASSPLTERREDFRAISVAQFHLCLHFWARCLMLVTYQYWIQKTWPFTFFWVVAHVFSNTGPHVICNSNSFSGPRRW